MADQNSNYIYSFYNALSTSSNFFMLKSHLVQNKFDTLRSNKQFDKVGHAEISYLTLALECSERNHGQCEILEAPLKTCLIWTTPISLS